MQDCAEHIPIHGDELANGAKDLGAIARCSVPHYSADAFDQAKGRLSWASVRSGAFPDVDRVVDQSQPERGHIRRPLGSVAGHTCLSHQLGGTHQGMGQDHGHTDQGFIPISRSSLGQKLFTHVFLG